MKFLASLLLLGLSFNDCQSQNITVQTPVGLIVGEYSSTQFDGTTHRFRQFLGIPYAESPTGDRRFRKPVKKANFTEPFLAKTMPPYCPQNQGVLDYFGLSVSRDLQSEDCLNLNVLAPETNSNEQRAVMVFFHCGLFEFESQNWYLARLLVATQEIVYVTIDFRLSVFGFLSTGDDTLPGNNGFWDQRLALQWVKDNIASFGGDPNKVTIAGLSSGSVSVIHQALHRGNQNLFNGVIAQSGSANTMTMFENEPLERFNEISNKTGCLKTDKDETIACLRGKPFTEVMDAVNFDLIFQPVVDGEFVEMHPNDVFKNTSDKAWAILRAYGSHDIIFGLTSNEGALYLKLMDALVKPDGASALNGYTRDAFEDKIIPFALELGKLKDTPTLRRAILHQYIQWWTTPTSYSNNKQSAIDLVSDTTFNAGVIKSAMMHNMAGSGGMTYMYVFDHRSRISPPGIDGANHAEDLPFALGFPVEFMINDYGINFTDPIDEFTPADIQLSQDMMSYWGRFTKHG